MKKIMLTLALMGVILRAFASKIETTTGITHKGSFVRRTGDLFFIKTNLGEVGIFVSEITKVYSDTGEDVTDHFLALPSDPVPAKALKEGTPDHLPPISSQLAFSQPDLSTPLWVIAISTVIYYTYSIIRIENPKKQKTPTVPGT